MFVNTSTVTAGVNVQPAVRPGDMAVVTLDGQQVPGVPPNGGQFTISPVDRGTHSIQVTIKDANGANVCSSPPVTFHVHQPSVLTLTPAGVRPALSRYRGRRDPTLRARQDLPFSCALRWGPS
jgi:hypothetical protein